MIPIPFDRPTADPFRSRRQRLVAYLMLVLVMTLSVRSVAAGSRVKQPIPGKIATNVADERNLLKPHVAQADETTSNLNPPTGLRDPLAEGDSSDSPSPVAGTESPTPRDPDTSPCHRVIQVASANPPGSANYGDAASGRPVISSNGRFVCFSSVASNISPNDTALTFDLFVCDRLAHQLENVHFNASHEPANNVSLWISSISAEGRFVLYTSYATNLVPGTTNISAQAYLLDRQMQTIELVSIGLDGAQPDNACYSQGMTPEGRFVTFYSNATNLVPGDTNNQWDVFRRDRLTGQTIRCSVGLAGAQANGPSGIETANTAPTGISSRQVVISADGNLVAFASRASNLVASDTNNTRDVFVFNCSLGQTERVNVGSGGQQANGPSAGTQDFGDNDGPTVDMTPDGRFVAFNSQASNLVAPDPDGTTMNVFIRDRATNTTFRVPVNGTGFETTTTHPSLSTDGRYVALETSMKNVVPGQDPNSKQDYLWYDRMTGELRQINANTQGEGSPENQASGNFYGGPMISDDGRYVVFPANVATLVNPPPQTIPIPPDDISKGQVYLRDMLARDCNGNGTIDACDPGWLDLTVFINALLASPQDPAMVCAYDFNRDGQLNGLDVAPFTAELINPY